MRTSRLLALALLAAPLAATGCSSCGKSSSGPAPEAASSAAPGASESAAAPPPKAKTPAPSRQGNVVARSPAEDLLYVVDEDGSALHLVQLPFDKEKPAWTVALPGRPAQVLPLDGEVLVTIRDPGLVLVMKPDGAKGLVESARIALPADAWGLAITKDEKTALVSSAWTHEVSAVDLETKKVRFTVDVAREPRGIAILGDGSRAYVSHLVGASLTRIDGIGTGNPTVKRVSLPAAPLRLPYETTSEGDASLGYALTFSPDERRLFVARHAFGAVGVEAWYGMPIVDVLLPRDDSPLAPRRKQPAVFGAHINAIPPEDPTLDLRPGDMVQPRAMVYRGTTRTLLVLGEGSLIVSELDATSIDPAAMVRTKHPLHDEGATGGGPACAAPSGLALSSDEGKAYVFCRATNALAVLTLPDPKSGAKSSVVRIPLGKGPDDALAAEGRRLFYDAQDTLVSGGLGCAACHPEGRDDGFTWTEFAPVEDGGNVTFSSHGSTIVPGAARQTPMLAGRVAAQGPYGWHGESETLVDRILAGFALHRWDERHVVDKQTARPRALAIAAFLRAGLVPPPREKAELSDVAKRGKAVFESAETACKTCHAGAEYTDRVPMPLPRMTIRAGYADEKENNKYKTPSLLFVGGTAPYFHDGSYATLEELIDKNDDRMGKTNQLSAEDKAALVAYLRTL
ncbi:c-type cytochrome [Polyangium sp. 15x6]|uniref:c-type cytochrome n=1 Tax=Polyangium sp. 15x6 TaxID=3042687 RepID=UPI00249BB41B|nr:c-type cytochrome [Polyangium sp. 15x6]MDI3286892.1 c-type cytochrome [Polyangium sp. 15x6]